MVCQGLKEDDSGIIVGGSIRYNNMLNQYIYITTDKIDEKGMMSFVTTIQFIAKTNKEVEQKVRKMIKRKHYFLNKIIEAEEGCADYQDKMFKMQEKFFGQIVKAIKEIKDDN